MPQGSRLFYLLDSMHAPQENSLKQHGMAGILGMLRPALRRFAPSVSLSIAQVKLIREDRSENRCEMKCL